MARTPKLNQLTEVQVKAYANKPGAAAPLHDGGGLYLRRRESAAYWYLRLTDPETKAEQWHRCVFRPNVTDDFGIVTGESGRS